MITEKILQAYKDGRTIKNDRTHYRYNISNKEELSLDHVTCLQLTCSKWEVITKKVPYYPVLFKDNTKPYPDNLRVSKYRVKELDEFFSYGSWDPTNRYEPIRLLTEVPELIEYREE